MEQITEHEVVELSLEKVIETKLVQANVTETVLAALKEKYGGMTLKAIDDKESYLELKAAKKDCAKVRNLGVKVCTEGRDDALKTQKKWLEKQKWVVNAVLEVEDALDAEIKRFDDEVNRREAEEIRVKEEAYINRQAQLTKLGATYQNGNFVLGEASFESELVKGASQDVWEEAIVPKFQAEYERIEAVRFAEEQAKAEREAAFKSEQERLRQEQEEFRQKQEEFNRQQAEAARIKREEELARENEMLLAKREADFKIMKEKAAEEAEAKRVADIETAIKKEQERQAEEARQAEIKKQQEEERKKAELEAAGDKVKWDNFIATVKKLETFEMRSGQYRRKMQIAKEKIEEILAL